MPRIGIHVNARDVLPRTTLFVATTEHLRVVVFANAALAVHPLFLDVRFEVEVGFAVIVARIAALFVTVIG